MKIFKSLFFALVFALFFTGLSFSQNQFAASLNCNVDSLKAGIPAYKACHFVGQVPNTDTREFTTYVEVGDAIIWSGQSTDGNTKIDIKKIKHEDGTNVFDKDELEGQAIVVGTIKKKTNGEPYKYKISFKINNKRKMYSIDPKIRAGGGE